MFLANKVPVHVTNAERAGELYARHAGQDLLQPPIGGPARMAAFPPLVPADYAIPGAGWKESAQDVAIAGLGWVAVTIGQGLEAKIRAWAPEVVFLFFFTNQTIPLLPSKTPPPKKKSGRGDVHAAGAGAVCSQHAGEAAREGPARAVRSAQATQVATHLLLHSNTSTFPFISTKK